MLLRGDEPYDLAMAQPTGAPQRGLRIFGFPLTIQGGFVWFMAIIAFTNLDNLRAGLYVAGALAAFTLLHELGHAVVARSNGCDASISLGFFAGYTMFTPRQPLTRSQRAAISVAGPAIQIVTASVVLLALGSRISFRQPYRFDEPLVYAVWWAGLMIGALNLIPVRPLDGGSLAGIVFERAFGSRADDVMRVWTVLVLALLWFAAISAGNVQQYLFLLVLITAMALQGLPNTRRQLQAAVVTPEEAARREATAANAERAGWAGAPLGTFPAGFAASPWLRAYALLRAGKERTASGLLVQSLQQPGGGWVLPDDVPLDALSSLVALVPDPAPVDQLRGGWSFHWALHRVGQLRRAADYGARLYERHGQAMTAHNVAGELALMGLEDSAMQWLNVAYGNSNDVASLDADHDLDGLRHRFDFMALRDRMAGRVAPPWPPPG